MQINEFEFTLLTITIFVVVVLNIVAFCYIARPW